MLISQSIVVLAAISAQQVYAATITSSGYAPQFSPSFPGYTAPSGVVTSYNAGPYDTTTTLSTTPLSGFPTAWEAPDPNHPEVQAVYKKIDWSKVPKAPVRKQKSDGSWVSDSDGPSDPYCWWSSTNCVVPKASYLPSDIYTCPNKGDWGLTYDDGPFNRYTDSNAAKENPYAEPALYNFLVKSNAHATLFYIGSNVANYPAAAKRGLNDGHSICVHTWSHPPLTTQTNAQIVAEFYWTLKAIKFATGVTSKCFRPPQGDVDDRVRAIAWQMGMRNILWDRDTNDWAMSAPGGGSLSPKTVDGYFQTWLNDYKSGKDRDGHIVLEHELNHATVNMSMFWLPKIQQTFNVLPALACNGVKQPYWESGFVYPTDNSDKPPATTTSKGATTSSSSTATDSPTPGSCTPGSKGLGNGDGYLNACCTDQSDCIDDCISGVCNGQANPNGPTTTTTTKPSTGKTTTTKKSSTKTTTVKPTPTGGSNKCSGGAPGKANGSGANGACCKTSEDCQETCRSGICGL